MRLVGVRISLERNEEEGGEETKRNRQWSRSESLQKGKILSDTVRET